MEAMRKYLGGLLAGVLLASSAVTANPAAGARQGVPRTGFEQRGGESWTTYEEGARFIARVNRMSDRVEIERIGRSAQGRPLQLLKLGAPTPHSRSEAREQPTILFVCSQHGDEPAGREACLMLMRDLAFTYGPTFKQQLRETTILFIPDPNPDGIRAGTTENASGIDIARDHLNLESPEARAVARVALDWRPDVVIDLHEFVSPEGGYEHEVLYVWPRDLNVDEQVHDLSVHLGEEYVRAQAEAHDYTSDEYTADDLAEDDPHNATDEDEGTLANAMGLRHALGLSVETSITEDSEGGTDPTGVRLRQVDAHMVVALAALQFLRREGQDAAQATAAAARRKTAEGRRRSAPVYFDGSDIEEPTEVQDPPPCGYDLTSRQLKKAGETMALLDIAALGTVEGAFVPMGQPAEPLIPLLLDARASRNEVSAEPLMSC